MIVIIRTANYTHIVKPDVVLFIEGPEFASNVGFIFGAYNVMSC